MNRDSLTTIRNEAIASPVWFLVGHVNGIENSHIPIKKPIFLIGRNHDSDLALSVPTVSSRHAEIRIRGDSLTVTDLGSTNGTFVNGVRIEHEQPIRGGDLVLLADVALRIERQDAEIFSRTQHEDVYDQALALVQFDRLLNEKKAIPYYQPIVDLKNDGAICGYEVLGRSSLIGVETPYAMFKAAAKLNLEVQLSTMLRWVGIEHSLKFGIPQHLYVNTHPRELGNVELVESLEQVRKLHPNLPLTLEIHEGAITDVPMMAELRRQLRGLDIKLAYDDFGAGQARLVELIKVQPDVLKFDIRLIKNIDKAPLPQQQMIESLVKMVNDLGVIPLAEGVETLNESVYCNDLGFVYGQGFFYGKPAPISTPTEPLHHSGANPA